MPESMGLAPRRATDGEKGFYARGRRDGGRVATTAQQSYAIERRASVRNGEPEEVGRCEPLITHNRLFSGRRAAATLRTCTRHSRNPPARGDYG
jgi:hypothetical protein